MHIARQAPEEMPTVPWPADQPEVHLPALLERAFGITTVGGAPEPRPGRGQARRGDGRHGSLDLPAAEVDGKVLQLGKRRFARVRVASRVVA